MSRKTGVWITGLVTVIVFVTVGILFTPAKQEAVSNEKLEDLQLNPVQTKEARAEYFFQLLRDPEINRIPDNIRSRELDYSRTLPSRNSGFLQKGAQANQASTDITWQSAGPTDLGGRTRALGIDQRDSDVLLAGGASGGIWKSIDGGDTWEMKTDPNQNMSVTSLAQDPSNPETWYYTSGEFRGNSASDRAQSAPYYGTGIYKSTDNGESWSIISSTEDTDNTLSSRFDYISRIKVSPTTGSVFAASNGVGLLRSTDGGDSFPIIKGDLNHHSWTDFDIDSDGNIVAVFSSVFLSNSNPGNDPGIFYSDDDGDSWTDITPTDFPNGHDRSVVTFAPSESDSVYVFTNKDGSQTNQGVSFFKIDVSDPQNTGAEDRSGNLPNFGGEVGGVNTQGNYNMVISVKPDDPDFVMVGATNLFRSRDGFASTPSYDNSDSEQKNEYWIGGYSNENDVSQYQNQHPDQHVITYDPNNPNEVWTGHDGGLSVTSDVTATPVDWEDKDEGYVTSQFYTVAIGPNVDDDRVMGGTQDNGTPFFRVGNSNQQQTSILDVSSGDGSYAFWGSEYAYVSSQNGNVLRLEIENDGSLTSAFDGSTSTDWSNVYPSNASNMLFIHPYTIDPNDDTIMYYPGGATMWRNTEVDEIPNHNQGGTTEGWESFEAVSDAGYIITTLEVTTVPSDRLYYGASSGSSEPKIFKLNNATTSEDVVDVSIPDAESGAYVHDIAINPNNGDEVVVVMSNYGIPNGLYHSSDAGDNWTLIEGNLEGDNTNPGPSLRSATIFPTSSEPIYYVGTSTGLYSAGSLSGSNTSWTRESDDGTPGSIGYSVAEYVTSRPSDGTIAVGSHGRGIYLGSLEVTGKDPNDETPPASPTALETGSASDDVQITWEANTESDVDKYRIYRGNEVDALSLHDSTSAFSTSYLDTDTDFETYYYRITAVDINGNESDFSNTTAVIRNYLTVNNQWRLVGMPLTQAEAADVPNSLEVFSFNGAYQMANNFDIHSGFWVKSTSEDSIKYNGGAFTDATIPLESGWNLIGGVAETTSTSSINDPDNILSSTPIFEYSGGSYDDATNIKPTSGYWIYADQDGDIELSISESSSSAPKERFADVRQSVGTLEFRQGNSTQLFYLADGPVKTNTRNMFRMPPESPSPVLDVRTSDDFRLAEGKATELEITTKSYPVKVTMPENSTSSEYVLKGVTDQDTVMYNLSAGKEAVIQQAHDKLYVESGSLDQLITEHELLPNYPNPFNPTTNIEYKIASQTHVSLSVYDVLGRRIRTLVNEVQEPGTYTKTFNAQNLSSGTYFIRINAENFSNVRQMTLIK